jgi:hypothetical protein
MEALHSLHFSAPKEYLFETGVKLNLVIHYLIPSSTLLNEQMLRAGTGIIYTYCLRLD